MKEKSWRAIDCASDPASSNEPICSKAEILARQNDLIRRIAERIGRAPDVRQRFTSSLHDISLFLTPRELCLVRGLNGIQTIQIEKQHMLTKDRSGSADHAVFSAEQ